MRFLYSETVSVSSTSIGLQCMVLTIVQPSGKYDASCFGSRYLLGKLTLSNSPRFLRECELARLLKKASRSHQVNATLQNL